MRCGGISPRTERVNLPARIPYWLLPKMLLFENFVFFLPFACCDYYFVSIDRKFLVFVFFFFSFDERKKMKIFGGFKIFFLGD